MTFTSYLRALLASFVDSYQKHLKQTWYISLLCTAACIAIAYLLSKFNIFDRSVGAKPSSLLSYFFNRYSKGSTYSVIDLTKTVFIYSAAIYAVALSRLSGGSLPGNRLSFGSFFRGLNTRDLLVLTAALAAACYMDLILFKTETAAASGTHSRYAALYVHGTFFHLRIYLPLILFALVIRFLQGNERTALTFKTILWLYISLWLYNEFAYEVAGWVRAQVFGLVLMPFAGTGRFFILESIAGIPMVAFYYIGYYVALTMPLRSATAQVNNLSVQQVASS